jgi:tetratricopeptide (TPR) repeat protein
MVDGKVADKVSGVQSKYGDSTIVNFDLKQTQQQQQATAQANESGQLTDQQQRGMSKEQKEQYEAQLKQRAEQMKKNKALNDAYNAGKDALTKAQGDTDPAAKTTDYQTAIDNFKKASDLDATQEAVWAGLADAYYGLGQTQTGDEKTKSFDAALDAYKKVLTINPNEAAIYNQIGNIYGAEKKIPEATEALTKAAQLDPKMASKAYFNMGANLVNSGQSAQAADFFKKATDADPNYAEAWYQYGSLLMMKGAVDPKTGQQTYPPETAPALKKYLELQPTGAHAQEATAMLQAMGETVQTKITAPGSTSKKKKQ